MTDSIFQFGERRPVCQAPVLNERAVRASAGMLYLMVLNNVIGPINMIVCSVCLLLLAALIAFTAQWVYGSGAPPMRSTPAATAPTAAGARDPAEEERCRVPEFAKAMGHEEKWKQHNHCQ